jgi:hypothetical protein
MISADAVNWLFTLVTSISFAFIGLLVPNLYKQVRKPRSHNREKFVNEFLARHQLTYTTFFAAIALTAEFQPGFDWVKRMFAIYLAITMGCYFFGVYFSVQQDDIFVNHGCIDSGRCPTTISVEEFLRLCRTNLCTSVFLFASAITLLLVIK